MKTLIALMIATSCLVSTGAQAAANREPVTQTDMLSALIAPTDTTHGLKVFGVAALLAIAFDALRNKPRESQAQRR